MKIYVLFAILLFASQSQLTGEEMEDFSWTLSRILDAVFAALWGEEPEVQIAAQPSCLPSDEEELVIPGLMRMRTNYTLEYVVYREKREVSKFPLVLYHGHTDNMWDTDSSIDCMISTILSLIPQPFIQPAGRTARVVISPFRIAKALHLTALPTWTAAAAHELFTIGMECMSRIWSIFWTIISVVTPVVLTVADFVVTHLLLLFLLGCLKKSFSVYLPIARKVANVCLTQICMYFTCFASNNYLKR